jgi:ribosomal-protein-alanine N-acetyltransferase
MGVDQMRNDSLVLHTRRLQLMVLDERAAATVLDYYVRNRAFHDPWFPARDDHVFTIRQQLANLVAEKADFLAGRAMHFWLSRNEEPDRIIGRIAFTQIVYGGLRSAFMAWHLDQACQHQGLAFEAGQAAIERMFADFGLHRLEAAILPGNTRSIALATRLGFELEGVSPRYLQINGVWEDHLRYVLLSDGPLWPDKTSS